LKTVLFPGILYTHLQNHQAVCNVMFYYNFCRALNITLHISFY